MVRAVGVEVCPCNLEKQEMSTIHVELPDHLQSYVDESAVQPARLRPALDRVELFSISPPWLPF